MTEREWRYYLPDLEETAEDAQLVPLPHWVKAVHTAEDAAELAAKDEWNNRDGWEAGIGAGPTIAVIAPDGTETRFTTEREADICHYVSEVPTGCDKGEMEGE